MNAPKLLFALLAIGTPAFADVLYSDFGPGNSFNSASGWQIGGASDFAIAASFVPVMTANVADIRVAVNNASDFNGHYVVELATNNGGKPGSTIEAYTNLTFPNSPSILTINSATNPLLTAGTTYWITMFNLDEPSGLGFWFENNIGRLGLAFENSSTLNWTLNTDVATPAFAVDGTTSAPEPSVALLLIGGLAALYSTSRMRHFR